MRKIIQWRILLLCAGITLVSIGGFALTCGILLNQWISRLWMANIQQIGFVLADQVASSLDREWNESDSSSLSASVSEHSSYDLYVILPDGKIKEQPVAPNLLLSNIFELPEVQTALKGSSATREFFNDSTDETYIFLAFPAKKQNQPVLAVLLLVVSKNELGNLLQPIRQWIAIISLGFFLLSLPVSYLVVEYSFKPLHLLIRQISNFEPSAFPALSGTFRQDEFGELDRAFKSLTSRLRDHIEDLESEQSTLSAVLENMTDGIIIVDTNGVIVMMNPAAKNIFDVNHKETKGKTITEIVRYHQFIGLWKKCMESGSLQSISLEISPSYRFIQGIATPLQQEGKADTCLLVFQDLTRLRKLEMVRRDFVSNVSHELRTPLASLKIMAETLNEGALEDPPAARNFVKRMESEIDNLTQLVQELLELSRIESGLVPIERKLVQACDLVKPAVERMSMQAARAGLTLNLFCGDDLPMVYADPARISQVMLNLIHNAIKFTPPGGSIDVYVSVEPESIIFSVKDTGVGIDETALSRIFERFYKADRARSGGGTGLGLSIARHLVELHGGKIWAESKPDQGSTFSFLLPIIKNERSSY